METWWFIVFEFAVGLALLAMSGRQPFPGPSRRYATILLIIAALLFVGETAPNPTGPDVHMMILLVYGGLGLISGVNNMMNTREEVIVAPFAGILFSVSATGLMAAQWDSLSKFEAYAAFGTIVIIGAGQTWLVFRGSLIGRLPLAWSKAGLVALQRGDFSGEHGAIECFERAWDLEEEHLNPMAWYALEQIHKFLGNEEQSQHWGRRLAESGGVDAMANEWKEIVDSSLDSQRVQSEEE